MKSPQQQAYDEVKKVMDAERSRTAGGANGMMKVSAAYEMCERLMITAWVRGYTARNEELN